MGCLLPFPRTKRIERYWIKGKFPAGHCGAVKNTIAGRRSFYSCRTFGKSNARGENSRQNNESIVGQLKYGNFTMLFTGDAEAEEEASILKNGADIKSIVLKAGHHGSKTSSTEEFLRAVSPKAVFISCGAGNNYGHPSRQTMKRLENGG